MTTAAPSPITKPSRSLSNGRLAVFGSSFRSDSAFMFAKLASASGVIPLAESGELNVFRPFPDLETSELAVLHLESRRVLGVQVKTGGVDAAHPTARINIRAASFRPSHRCAASESF